MWPKFIDRFGDLQVVLHFKLKANMFNHKSLTLKPELPDFESFSGLRVPVLMHLTSNNSEQRLRVYPPGSGGCLYSPLSRLYMGYMGSSYYIRKAMFYLPKGDCRPLQVNDTRNPPVIV